MQSVPNNFLLFDTRERNYANVHYSETQALSLKKGMYAAGRALRTAVTAFSRFVADIINAQAEARARDQRYSRTPW